MTTNNKQNKILTIMLIIVIFIIFLSPALIAIYSINSDTIVSTSITNSNIKVEFIPAYNNELVVTLNNNEPFFTNEEKQNTQAFEKYSEIDKLGRVGVAYANVCRELQPPQGDKRGNISSIKPSGWLQATYDCVDGKNLYNRSHLIGWQLTDEDANKNNLMTGTRYFNVQGMLPFEDLVDEHLEQFNHHILYRVTPVFQGNNLVATGVVMEGYCIEHKGEMINFNVFVYNVQPNVIIDYTTGKSELSK